MSHYHAAVWIDHQRSTVWQFTPTEEEGTHVHAHGDQRVHSRKSSHGGHKSPADRRFFDDVAHALVGSHEILILGPAQTKQEFAAYLRDKHADLGRSIVAVEMRITRPMRKSSRMRDAISRRSIGCSPTTRGRGIRRSACGDKRADGCDSRAL